MTGEQADPERRRFKCVICNKWHDGRHAKDLRPELILSTRYCSEHFWDPANEQSMDLREAVEYERALGGS